jgi:predicted glutamine amidotransferase
MEGSTDSEVFFFLALTMGLEDDPPAAVERAVGVIEHVGRSAGVEHPGQMTVATSDGRSLWAYRYSSEGKSRSLYYLTRVDTLREQHPEIAFLQKVSDESRLVVSEPLGDLFGAWKRSARVQLRHRPGRAGRAPSVHTAPARISGHAANLLLSPG